MQQRAFICFRYRVQMALHLFVFNSMGVKWNGLNPKLSVMSVSPLPPPLRTTPTFLAFFKTVVRTNQCWNRGFHDPLSNFKPQEEESKRQLDLLSFAVALFSKVCTCSEKYFTQHMNTVHSSLTSPFIYIYSIYIYIYICIWDMREPVGDLF